MAKEDARLLIKIAKEFEKLAEQELYLDADISEIGSIENSRHPIDLDEVCVGDYALVFHLDGRDFLANASVRGKFSLHIEEYDMRSYRKKIEGGYSQSFVFSKSETKALILEKIKTILADIRSTTAAGHVPRHYFNMWANRQGFGSSNSTGNQAMRVQDLLYGLLPQKISHAEFEKRAAERHKANSSRIDWKFKPDISRISKVEAHSVLDRLFFAVVSKDEVFLCDTEKEAMDLYEEQTMRRIGEVMAEDAKEFDRLKSLR